MAMGGVLLLLLLPCACAFHVPLGGLPRASTLSFSPQLQPSLPLSLRQNSLRGHRNLHLSSLRAQLKPEDRATSGAAAAAAAPAGRGDLDWVGIQKQFSTFARIAAPYFREEKTAKVLIAIVVGLTLINSAVSVQFSYLSRDFWTALNQKNPEEFNFVLQKFTLALLAGVPISVSYKYYRDKLALQWRGWLSQRVLDMFQTDRAYYLLEARKEVDNPDQRVAEDVRAFTRVSLDFSITLLKAVIDLASFSTILLSIYPELFGAIIVYASFGTFCTVAIGNKLVGINFEQLQREADFRFSLMRMRENAESIAFYGGEGIEMGEIKKRLDLSLNNFWSLIRAQRNLEFFTVAYSYMVQVIPGAVISPLFFAGKIELGVVSQSYGAFNHILNDLSIIVRQFEDISSFSAGIDRLGEFVDKMEESRIRQLSVQRVNNETSAAEAKARANEMIGISNVTWREAVAQAFGFSDTLTNPPLPLESGAELLARAGKEIMPLALVNDAGGGLRPRVVAPEHGAEHGSSAEHTGAAVGGKRDDQAEAHVGPDKAVVSPKQPPGATALACEIGEIESSVEPGAVLNIKDLTLVTPDCSRLLVEGLSLDVKEGQHLLIVGDSGTGKSSLLRAVAGLWTAGSGCVTRPPPGETFFLPQRPYCTLGTLREQLLYPRLPGGRGDVLQVTDTELLDVLQKVRLPKLAQMVGEDGGGALDCVRDWTSMLSLGEQQRLAFGRLLVNKPSLAILDEASSALDLDSEKAMYGLLDEIPGLTYISVGHRPSLLNYHDSKLRLLSDHGFRLEKIEVEDPEAVMAASSSM
uniref:ABC transporter domain-containing protein n=2 Tax=Hemiselmis andersenii TaxID=464988 RepID=A0A7S1EFL4_HEMAN|mmetsp:Transcript_47965/g.116478  ORF Transcript_47965/g.116478 Transcript_47965/m.116478 type:complete len:807 (+) Transcript_47965:36-2456(+)